MGRPDADTVLLSFPRSGNHAARALIEATTRKPTLGCADFGILPSHLVDRPIFLRSDVELAVRGGSPVVRKSHTPSEASTQKLIVILRDPVEAILSHERDKSDTEFVKVQQQRVDLWLGIAATWTKWIPENRHLIHYSDLSASAVSVVNDLHHFLGFQTFYSEENEEDLQLIGHALEAGKRGLERPASDSPVTYRKRFPDRAAAVQAAIWYAAENSSDDLRTLVETCISRQT